MSFWYRFLDWWNPVKVYVALFFGAIAIDSIVRVWGNRRPVGDFFEEFIAGVMVLSLPVAAFVAAAVAGTIATSKANSTAIGWVVGVTTFFLVGVVSYLAVAQVPGVNWRFERLQEMEY